MKAVWIVLDRDPWGHSVARLIRDLSSEEAGLLTQHEKAALSLDKLYIPTRYPDALVELTPSEAYTEEEAREARESASELIDDDGHDRPARILFFS